MCEIISIEIQHIPMVLLTVVQQVGDVQAECGQDGVKHLEVLAEPGHEQQEAGGGLEQGDQHTITSCGFRGRRGRDIIKPEHISVTSTNLRPAWRKEDSSRAWTLATLIRLEDGEERGMGESSGERGAGEEGELGSVGGKSW